MLIGSLLGKAYLGALSAKNLPIPSGLALRKLLNTNHHDVYRLNRGILTKTKGTT